MAHPFFDSVEYPWQLSEAQALHEALSAAIETPGRMGILYQSAGLPLPALAEQQDPANLIWKDELERLSASGKLRSLCDALLASPDYGGLHEKVKAVRRALEPGVKAYLTRLIDEIEPNVSLDSEIKPKSAAHGGETRSMGKRGVLVEKVDYASIRIQLRHRKAGAISGKPSEKLEFDDVLKAFRKLKRAAVLGATGSGKSTTLRKLALDLARQALQKGNGEPIPILAHLGKWVGDEPLADFIAATAPELNGFAKRKTVLLLDALNEMPTGRRAAMALEIQKLGCVGAFVSCRKEDYVGDLALGFDTLELEPLSRDRILAVLKHWVTQRGQPAELAEELFWQLAGAEKLKALLGKWLSSGASKEQFWTATHPKDFGEVYKNLVAQGDELWLKHIPDPQNLLKLAENPFLLRMLYLVWAYSENGRLPANRGRLLAMAIETTLLRENLAVEEDGGERIRLLGEGEALVKGLTELAWAMRRGEDSVPEALIAYPRDPALRALGGGEARLKLAVDAGLVEGRDLIQFRHQMLQVYFAARALGERLGTLRATDFWPVDRWWERKGWEEPLTMLSGFHDGGSTPVADWVAEAQPELAARCLLESGPNDAVAVALRARLRALWIPHLTGNEPAVARAIVGRALGRLGLDNRPGVGLRADDGVPDIDWVAIPAGTFRYQDEEQLRGNGRFHVARYPITTSQFQAFLDAEDGYRNDALWSGLDAPDRTPCAPLWSEPNHPRARVNWYEAMAFCGWLSRRLGYAVRLPTEEEWERAARGTDGREYPWGSGFEMERANTAENEFQRTTPVGAYPNGASADGVLELSGNVWEWCLNEYSDPTKIQSRGNASRVLRGGSWCDDQGFARAAVRSLDNPRVRDYGFGFRVVCLSPSPTEP